MDWLKRKIFRRDATERADAVRERTDEERLGDELEALCNEDPKYRMDVASQCAIFKIPFNGETVVVKRVPYSSNGREDADADDPNFFMKREWLTPNDLDHENVLKIRAMGKTKDCRYLVMDECAGSLDQILQMDATSRPVMPSDLRVLYEIASGVAHIHERDKIHRDIKPQNILLTKDTPAKVKVADFGCSKGTTPVTGTASWSGSFGTQDYRSAECIRWERKREQAALKGQPRPPRDRISNKIDVTSTGIVFFYYLSGGRHPFGSGEEVTSNIYQGDPVLFDEVMNELPELSDDVKEIIRKMIDADPDKRPSMELVKKTLEPLLIDE